MSRQCGKNAFPSTRLIFGKHRLGRLHLSDSDWPSVVKFADAMVIDFCHDDPPQESCPINPGTRPRSFNGTNVKNTESMVFLFSFLYGRVSQCYISTYVWYSGESYYCNDRQNGKCPTKEKYLRILKGISYV